MRQALREVRRRAEDTYRWRVADDLTLREDALEALRLRPRARAQLKLDTVQGALVQLNSPQGHTFSPERGVT